MSANLELQILGKIFQERDFHTVEKLKITDEFFQDHQNKQIFEWVRTWYHHAHTYGQVPSWEMVRYYFPSLPYVTSQDYLASLLEQLRWVHLRNQLVVLANDILAEADSNPESALGRAKEKLMMASSSQALSEDLLLSQAGKALQDEYNLVASGMGLTGIPWPWEILNEDTQGIHNGDFIVIYGRPKSMKTFVGLTIGIHAYFHGNARVLVFSYEMQPLRVLRRSAAILAQVDWDKLCKGKLNPVDRDKYFATIDLLARDDLAMARPDGHTPAFMVSGRRKGDSSVGGIMSLQAKIREFKPDLVIVDGMYLMKDDRGNTRAIDWKNVAHISQDLKGTAGSFDVPIIGITQAKRGSAKTAKDADLEELAYADAIGQDTDLAIRVQKREDPVTKDNEIILNFPGSRESKLDGFVIHGIPAVNFGFKTRVINPDPPQPNNGPNQGHGQQQGRGGPPLINFKHK